jgi:hypothetical protein
LSSVEHCPTLKRPVGRFLQKAHPGGFFVAAIEPREWAVGLISTVVTGIGGRAIAVQYFRLQEWVDSVTGLVALGGTRHQRTAQSARCVFNEAKKMAGLTIVRMLVTGLVLALLAGAFVKLKVFGGGQ